MPGPALKNDTSNFNSTGLFQQLAAQTISLQYGKGEAIFSQGDAADALFRVEDGNVKLTVQSQDGKKAVIAVLRAGECFGESCVAGKMLRTYTATSLRQATIHRISKQALLRRLRDKPAFARLFISHLLLRVARAEDNLVDQLMNSSERRLARLLLQLSDLGKSAGDPAAPVHVDQGTLAQVVGTTRSRVSHFMNQFRKKGFIDYNGSLQVHPALRNFLRQRPPA